MTNTRRTASETPPELVPQFKLVREATDAFGLARVERPDFEADDLIASYACAAAANGDDVTIVSSDKDLMQLVSPHIRMFDPIKNRPIGDAEVKEKFGVGPEKVIDVQALCGDSVDNVPGVPGIGVKTAAELINTYGIARNAAGARAGDQAAEAPPEPDRFRRAGAPVEEAGRARHQGAADPDARPIGDSAARHGEADQVPRNQRLPRAAGAHQDRGRGQERTVPPRPRRTRHCRAATTAVAVVGKTDRRRDALRTGPGLGRARSMDRRRVRARRGRARCRDRHREQSARSRSPGSRWR